MPHTHLVLRLHTRCHKHSTMPHRQVHPGLESDGRRFKLLEVTGVLGQV